MSQGTSADTAGVAAIVAGCLAVSVIISVVTGSYSHWPFVVTGIVVGLWAVAAINQ